jgi:hypothetical protein
MGMLGVVSEIGSSVALMAAAVKWQNVRGKDHKAREIHEEGQERRQSQQHRSARNAT